MKLAANNIKFIDNYLENSGIVYFDIRLEMADHVASALEGMEDDFYDNFKRYMAVHKAELLASYKKFRWTIARRMLGQLFTNAVKPAGLLLLGLMLSLVTMLARFAGEEQTFEIVEAIYVVLAWAFILHFYYHFLFAKKKFSATYTIWLSGYISIVWILPFVRPERILSGISDFAPIIYYTVFIYLLIIFYSMFISIRKQLMQRYNIINHNESTTSQNIG